MKLAVVSYKVCWPHPESPSGYATDGGFPFQMRALAEVFEGTVLCLPVADRGRPDGEIPLEGPALRIAPLTHPRGSGIWRKLDMPVWILRNMPALVREIGRADAVHIPLPGDIGTIGMLLVMALRKPLFVRYCGNWFVERTAAERFWKWILNRCAGGRNVVLATGGAPEPPSAVNPNIQWIFSTSLTESELKLCAHRHQLDPARGLRLVTTGRQEHGKGTNVVISALALLARTLPDISLDVVGDGRALGDFRVLAASLGVGDRVRFHGQVPHARVLELLREADLFCFPTASEGFPKSVIEALACGLPVITTRVSVLPMLIANGSGVLLDGTSPEELARTIAASVSDAERYSAMSASALEVARQFSLERWRDAIADSLRSAWGPLAVQS